MTVRLPDFSTSSFWNELRQKMGAEETFIMPTISISEISLKEIKKLQTGSISIENIKDHINPLDYTFDYNPVLLEGDLNQDEIVNVEDLIVLVEIVLTDMDISNYVMSVGDLNYDASIDLIDILILADMLAD